jgi:hypothetical protein
MLGLVDLELGDCCDLGRAQGPTPQCSLMRGETMRLVSLDAVRSSPGGGCSCGSGTVPHSLRQQFCHLDVPRNWMSDVEKTLAWHCPFTLKKVLLLARLGDQKWPEQILVQCQLKRF